ncbi:MAG: hypothetical protein ACOCQQ_00070 [Candidatus Nanoarchaeia archaeon]
MNFRENHLRKKGWSEEEIDSVKEIIKRREEKSPQKKKHVFAQVSLWISLCMVLLLGIIGVLLVEPFLFVVSPAGAIIIIGIAGLFVGTFAGIIVRDIELVEKKHHLFIGSIFPIISIITSIFLIATIKDILTLYTTNHYSAFVLGIVYGLCALATYLMVLEIKKRGESRGSL